MSSNETCEYPACGRGLNKDRFGNLTGNIKKNSLTFCSSHCSLEHFAPASTSSTGSTSAATGSPRKKQKTESKPARPVVTIVPAQKTTPQKAAPSSSAPPPAVAAAASSVLKEVKGDLFASTDSLAHCISLDLKMGKGIAKIFKETFGGVDELSKFTSQQGKKVGGCIFLKRGSRYIYYLITKEFFYDKPTMANLKLSLQAMRVLCEQHQVHDISIPQIGCGLDRLVWTDVKKLLQEVFHSSTISITVHSI